MNINSKNFVLRAIELRDQEYLRQMLNDPIIEKNVGGWSFPISEKKQINWFQNYENDFTTLKLAIENIEGQFIGMIGASDIDMKNGSAEVHIKLLEANFKNKGIGTEVMSAFIDYCFQQLRLRCVYAYVLEENVASIKMLKKCYFEEEGLLRKRVYKDGSYKNIVVLSRII